MSRWILYYNRSSFLRMTRSFADCRQQYTQTERRGTPIVGMNERNSTNLTTGSSGIYSNRWNDRPLCTWPSALSKVKSEHSMLLRTLKQNNCARKSHKRCRSSHRSQPPPSVQLHHLWHPYWRIDLSIPELTYHPTPTKLLNQYSQTIIPTEHSNWVYLPEPLQVDFGRRITEAPKFHQLHSLQTPWQNMVSSTEKNIHKPASL